jgi:hypothetical protein
VRDDTDDGIHRVGTVVDEGPIDARRTPNWYQFIGFDKRRSNSRAISVDCSSNCAVRELGPESISELSAKVSEELLVAVMMGGQLSLTKLLVHYRSPLRRHFGLQFGGIRARLIDLTLKLTKIELPCSESRIIRTIILTVFPSARVKLVNGYPESRVTVQYLSIKIRVSSFTSFFNAGAPSQGDTVSIELGKSRNEGGSRISWIYHFIPKPYIRIKLHGLDIRVEKGTLPLRYQTSVGAAPFHRRSNGLMCRIFQLLSKNTWWIGKALSSTMIYVCHS